MTMKSDPAASRTCCPMRYLALDLWISGTKLFPEHQALHQETGDLGPRGTSDRDCAAVLAMDTEHAWLHHRATCDTRLWL